MEQRIEQRNNDVDADAYPYVADGDHMVVTMATGLTWHGTLVGLHYRPDGLLACMRFLPEGDTEPVAINAGQIVAWRRGEPVRKPVGIPAELLNGSRFPGLPGIPGIPGLG